jgi:CBS domain-containing protein
MAQQQNNRGGGSSQRVRDIMTPNPVTVSEKDSIRDVARIMADEDTGVVPVVDGRKIIGLITDRDIVVRLVAEGKDAGSATVREAMTNSIRSVKEDSSIDDVMQLMSSAQVRRVPVVDDNNQLVGIVSLRDVATETNKSGRVGQAVEDISEGPANN